MSNSPLRLVIVGTGGIGSLHARLAAEHPAIELLALSGLDSQAPALAEELGVSLREDYRDLAALEPDAAIVATPNQLHCEVADHFARLGATLLIEKPIADTLDAAAQIIESAERCRVQVLVGHHRRHHHLVRTAAGYVSQHLGRLVATNTLITMRKPDSYYDVEWRRSEGAGPILVNLIHEVDLLRAVCGEIVAVQAAAGKVGRNFAFDDTATVIVHYENGALGTLVLSESTASPWSWEASVSDGMGFYDCGQDHAQFVGTEGSLAFPSLTAWHYDADAVDPGWMDPLRPERLSSDGSNPYVAQLDQLVEVSRGEAEPVVSGRDALRSLAVVDAVIDAAATGRTVVIDDLLSAVLADGDEER